MDVSTIPLSEIPRLVQRRGLLADIESHPLLLLSPQARDFNRRRDTIIEAVDFASALQLLPRVEGSTFALLLSRFFSFNRALPFRELLEISERKSDYLRIFIEWNSAKGTVLNQEQLAQLLLSVLSHHGNLETINYLDFRCIQNVQSVTYDQIMNLASQDNPDRFLFYLENLSFLNWIRPLNLQEYLQRYENLTNQINKKFLKVFSSTLTVEFQENFERALQEKRRRLTYVRRFTNVVDEGYESDMI